VREYPKYEETWQEFIHGDHISTGTIWGGEGLVLIVPIADTHMVSRIQEIQSQLSNRLPFSTQLPETLHITLRLFGNPPAERLAGLVAFLGETLADVAAFDITLARLNSFFRAPFLEVWDEGKLAALAARLEPGALERGFQATDYGPRGQIFHVTLGAYDESNDGAGARELLSELRMRGPGTIRVNELRLIKTSTGKPYRMTTLKRFPLMET
jgi:2'-5' RNA ligase